MNWKTEGERERDGGVRSVVVSSSVSPSSSLLSLSVLSLSLSLCTALLQVANHRARMQGGGVMDALIGWKQHQFQHPFRVSFSLSLSLSLSFFFTLCFFFPRHSQSIFLLLRHSVCLRVCPQLPLMLILCCVCLCVCISSALTSYVLLWDLAFFESCD